MKKTTLLEEIKRIHELTYEGKKIVLENDIWDLFTGKKHDEKLADVVEPELDSFYQSLNSAAQSGLSQRQAGQMDYQKEVETMQIGLQLLGYDLPRYGVDGKFGPETAQAVKKFKQDNLQQQVNEAADDLRDTLDTLGYDEKGSEINSGGEISDDLSSIVSKILTDFKKTNPGVQVIVTSGNDRFHKKLNYTSAHTTGQAVDVTLKPYNQNNAGVFKKILDKYTQGSSFSYIDEYENPSGAATGGHFHLQVGGVKVSGGASQGNQDMEQATPEMINKMIEMLKAKKITATDINQYTNVVAGVENLNYTGGTDNDFYKAILTGIGAPITSENLKFLYAWRQAEGHGGSFNPFNTTWKMDGSTSMNSAGVQSYKSAQDGLNATIKTLSKPNYRCITNGLRQNLGADKIAACRQDLQTWGTGDLVAKVVAGYNQGAKPKISTVMA